MTRTCARHDFLSVTSVLQKLLFLWLASSAPSYVATTPIGAQNEQLTRVASDDVTMLSHSSASGPAPEPPHVRHSVQQLQPGNARVLSQSPKASTNGVAATKEARSARSQASHRKSCGRLHSDRCCLSCVWQQCASCQARWRPSAARGSHEPHASHACVNRWHQFTSTSCVTKIGR